MSKTPIARGELGTIPDVGRRGRDRELDGARVRFVGWNQGYPWCELVGAGKRRPFVWSPENVVWDARAA